MPPLEKEKHLYKPGSNSCNSMLVFAGVLNNLLIRFLNIELSQGSFNYLFYGDKTMQCILGIAPIILHCLGW